MIKDRFQVYTGETFSLPTSDDHLNFEWKEPGCTILFSCCRQGNGASCHFFSDKRGLRKIKQAINEFCEFVFWLFDWCVMILAKVKLGSIQRLLPKCGFDLVTKKENAAAYMRLRNGNC